MEKIGKLAIASVGLEAEPTGDERPSRYVIPLGKFAALATVRPDGGSVSECGAR